MLVEEYKEMVVDFAETLLINLDTDDCENTETLYPKYEEALNDLPTDWTDQLAFEVICCSEYPTAYFAQYGLPGPIGADTRSFNHGKAKFPFVELALQSFIEDVKEYLRKTYKFPGISLLELKRIQEELLS